MEHDQVDRIERRQALWEELVTAEQQLLATTDAGLAHDAHSDTGNPETLQQHENAATRVSELSEDLRRLNHEVVDVAPPTPGAANSHPGDPSAS